MSTTRVRPCRLVPASGVNASPQRTPPVWQRSQAQALLPGRRGTARARHGSRAMSRRLLPRRRRLHRAARDPSPETDQGSRIPPSELHYDGTAYLVSPTVGIFSMATLEQGARTRAGVRVGDDLELVRDRYRPNRVRRGGRRRASARWGDADVSLVPSDCDRTRIFFGEDPIESITLTRYGTAK